MVGRADLAPAQPLVARWNGSTWSTVPTPTTGGQLSGVDGSASNNVWAVGTGDTGALTERWNGSSWSIVPNAAPSGASLSGVKTFSATNAWAVGAHTAATAPHTRTLVQRWTGTTWVADSTVASGQLSDLAPTGTSTVLGVGWRYDPNLSQFRTLGMHTTNG